VRRATISDPSGKVLSVVDVADTRSDRRRGLLGQTSIDTPMWFPKTRSVHTVGMQTSIDVAHIAKDGTILRVRTMPSGRVGRPLVKAVAILETAAGQCATLRIIPGQRVLLS
jgi:uncharacterized protein